MSVTRLLTIGAALLGAGAILAFAACGGDDAADTVARGEDFDRAFIDAMVPHHESAIEMARAAKEAGLGQPELVEVADDILATQQAASTTAKRGCCLSPPPPERCSRARIDALQTTSSVAGMEVAGASSGH